jgi:hypothetical protein
MEEVTRGALWLVLSTKYHRHSTSKSEKHWPYGTHDIAGNSMAQWCVLWM